MKLSYKWLKDYLPSDEAFKNYVDNVHKISEILTAVGLEVEGLELYESVEGGLNGLVIGEVMTCVQHPNADRLHVTMVNTGEETVQIVCGAPNVAAGQKVVVALHGTTLYPIGSESFKIKKSKIRGEESMGMLCAEDEIGLGTSHDGIIVLPPDAPVGHPVAEILPVYEDYILEIGLTPNRMDDQSHLGAAKDICAWLTYHVGIKAEVQTPLGVDLTKDGHSISMKVSVQGTNLTKRYSGIVISDINIKESPLWMQNRLKTIGVRPINNIVDITNYVLHATGQPLHAFDVDKISKNEVIVRTLPEGTKFVSLDEKERRLSDQDIMICDGDNNPMCIGGVFGGHESGVSTVTKNVFLESAVFEPVHIRKSIIRHDLRTDAASRFEKGVDLSNTVEVLKYAAALIREFCGGKISSDIYDIYQQPAERTVQLKYNYLTKLSGENFRPEDVENILTTLNYKVTAKDAESITVTAPESNPDVTIQADIVEDILRISGLDNIEIPSMIKMTPGLIEDSKKELFEEKVSTWLVGNGFSEIFTNSLTNEKYTEDNTKAVKILNSLTQDLTVLRQDMIYTALEAIGHNVNRQNKDLQFFEFGKTYQFENDKYNWLDHLCVYATGEQRSKSWRNQSVAADFFYMKGIAESMARMAGIEMSERVENPEEISLYHRENKLGKIKQVSTKDLGKFSIKQPVFYLDIIWEAFVEAATKEDVTYKPISKFPMVFRDLSMILDNGVQFGEIKNTVQDLKIRKLLDVEMFDLYKSEKLGKNKKSMALSFSFMDDQKTLTDKETDKMMQHITQSLQKTFNAEIRDHA